MMDEAERQRTVNMMILRCLFTSQIQENRNGEIKSGIPPDLHLVLGKDGYQVSHRKVHGAFLSSSRDILPMSQELSLSLDSVIFVLKCGGLSKKGRFNLVFTITSVIRIHSFIYIYVCIYVFISSAFLKSTALGTFWQPTPMSNSCCLQRHFL